MGNLVLIDDTDDQLRELADALGRILSPPEADIRQWLPTRDVEPQKRFEELVDENTVLVVTDYDLTRSQIGLFGATIVDWCQAKVIPVGDFSRGLRNPLPKEPSLFEIRIPNKTEQAAAYIAAVYRGFEKISASIGNAPSLLQRKKSPIGVLSEILGRSQEEPRFALYGVRLGSANTGLIDKLDRPTDDEKRRMLTYVIGHLLLNVILRFPGPILSKKALAAYCAINEKEIDDVQSLFASTIYAGPFSHVDQYFWLSNVDDVLDEINRTNPSDSAAETQGQLNREAIERVLDRQLSRHECPRCHGENGGFLCPLTQKTVCQLPNCSVGSSAWIPAGARLCRIEKDFYDEWAPILGF